jgi:hypothetical protein
MDPIPPAVFLEAYPPAIAAIGERLRDAVARAVPDVIERVRPGWRLIGFDVPNGRRTTYAAWIMPERRHIHLGFVQGALMTARDGRLEGAGITRNARWVTFTPGDAVDVESLAPLIREAVRVACLSRGERAIALMAAAESA